MSTLYSYGLNSAYAVILADVALSIMLGSAIGATYTRAYRGLFLSVSFVHTCVVTVLLVTFVVGTVQEADVRAQALGFMLVGLLGLIRFRTVVRDTREFTFIFISIVTGVLLGAGHRSIAILICITSLALLVFLERGRFGSPVCIAMRAKVLGDPGRLADYISALSEVAQRVDPTVMRLKAGEKTAYHFEILGRERCGFEDIRSSIENIPGSTDITISLIQRGKSGAIDDD